MIIRKDFIVCGGGFAGICAAVAAARHGISVALINDRPVLGGNGSSEILVGLCGATEAGRSPTIYASEGGIMEEIALEFVKHGGRSQAVNDEVLFDLIYREKNIELFLNTHITEVDTDGAKITAVYGNQLGTGKRFKFEAPIFSDCTGDSFVGNLAGAEYRYGREAKDEFDEDLAPDVADDKVMGGTILFGTEDMGKPVKYTKPSFACDFENEPFMKNINKPGLYRDIVGVGGQWWLEYGGQCDTIEDNEEIAFKLRSIVFGYWDYIKNSGKYPQSENLRINRISPIVGKRESRRLMGDYVLTQNDVEQKKTHNDDVAMGGWKLDLHAPFGIYDDEPATSWRFVDGTYMIPYRCLYSKNISNLFMAGRNISATHVALSSTRVMRTCAAMGQAVGTAAYICSKYSEAPRSVYENHIEELKSLLKYDDQAMMNYPAISGAEINKITASSSHTYENTKMQNTIKLDKHICIALPIETQKLDSVKFAVKNTSDISQKLVVNVLNGDSVETYRPKRKIGECTAEIAAGYDGWYEFNINAEVSSNRKIHIVFEKNDNIELYISDDRLTGVEAFNYYKAGESDDYDLIPLDEGIDFVGYERADYPICFSDIIPSQSVFSADMLINGYDRPYGLPNCWLSKDKDKQQIEIELKKKTRIENISCVFSTPIDGKWFMDMPKLIKDYEIHLLCDNNTVEKICVTDNHQRFNKHHLSGIYADKIVFIPKENYGAGYFEMYQLTVNGGVME